MRRIIFIISLCFSTVIPFQHAIAEVDQRSTEFGIWAGGAYYIGDINPYRHFNNTHFGGGLILRRNLNERITLRFNANYGYVDGYDAESRNAVQQARGLSFRSRIVELGPAVEFNFLPYKPGNPRRQFATLYLTAGINYFYMNPQTTFNGEYFDLQPLGTEGQGGPLNTKEYKTSQLCIPLGIGLRWNIGRRLCLNLEYGIRKTFTDYLDDVSGKYYEHDELVQQNGVLAAYLADPTGVGGANQMRGNPKNKDWYSLFGIGLTIKTGKLNKCPQPK